MFISFYDKNFKALQNNASLAVSDYSLIKKAVDFDDFTCVSQAFTENVNPSFVILMNDLGRYQYGAISGIPNLDKDGKTSLQASDLKTIFNNEIVFKFTIPTTLKEYFDELFLQFELQVNKESLAIEYDTSVVEDIEIGEMKPDTEKVKVYSVWQDCIVPYLKYYDCAITSSIDLKHKKIKFKIEKINLKHIPVKLWEITVKDFSKNTVNINQSTGVVTYNNNISYGSTYYLLENNDITTDPKLVNLFPVKNKLILKEANTSTEVDKLKKEANVEALKVLVEARYQESFTISENQINTFEIIDFGCTFDIYTERGKFYKSLPLGQIKSSNKDDRIFIIGYKPDNIVFYL